jgi:outer membrane protein assembly factor BamB
MAVTAGAAAAIAFVAVLVLAGTGSGGIRPRPAGVATPGSRATIGSQAPRQVLKPAPASDAASGASADAASGASAGVASGAGAGVASGAGEASIPSGPPRATAPGPFPGGLLIADRGNGRLLIVTNSGRTVWSFPGTGSLPPGQQFSADDAFIAPDHRTIVANDENHEVIDRIDIRTRRVIWQYGTYNQAGSGRGLLHTPDDAYPLANGDIVTADIRNCRILEISPAKHVVRQWGRTGVCRLDPPRTFDMPNGDTPLPDGGLLITEIHGSRVVRLDARGHVVFDVHVPATYPSDAQLDPSGNVVVVDYASPGAILRVSPRGRVLARYQPRTSAGRLDHPSLGVPLPNGMIALNDDGRDRVIVVNLRTGRIVWQYGHTDRHSRRAGFLSDPDGIDVLPPGVVSGLPAG